MISDVAWTWIKFDDVPLRDPTPALVIDALAAVLACGFWYARDGEPWLSDVSIGPVHIQDFKHARAAALRREIIARFEATTFVIEGEKMTAPDVAALFAADPIFARRCRALPKFEGLRRTLLREVPKAHGFCARQHERQLILPARGDVQMKKLLADEYED